MLRTRRQTRVRRQNVIVHFDVLPFKKMGDRWDGTSFLIFFSIFQTRCFTDVKMYCYILTLPPIKGVVMILTFCTFTLCHLLWPSLTQELLKPQCETSMFHLIALGCRSVFGVWLKFKTMTAPQKVVLKAGQNGVKIGLGC